jgi:hypothetical protein
MDAQNFANEMQYPVLFYASQACPAGDEVAILPDTYFPFNLADIEVDAQGNWKGTGDPRDYSGSTITKITIHAHKKIYLEQSVN